MCSTQDGYKIAEKDLELRGPGDFIAQAGSRIRQSGGVEMKFGSLGDSKLLHDAFAAAEETRKTDPYLVLPENEGTRRRIEKITGAGAS